MKKENYYTCYREPYTLFYHCEKGDIHKTCKSSILIYLPSYIPKIFKNIYFKYEIIKRIKIKD
jgi:hypothetical protein